MGKLVDTQGDALEDHLLPFVLSCLRCDAGDGIDSKEAAIKLGWTRVQRDVQGTSWNDLGLCPLCRKVEEETNEIRYGK